jgi:hypothetical protein
VPRERAETRPHGRPPHPPTVALLLPLSPAPTPCARQHPAAPQTPSSCSSRYPRWRARCVLPRSRAARLAPREGTREVTALLFPPCSDCAAPALRPSRSIGITILALLRPAPARAGVSLAPARSRRLHILPIPVPFPQPPSDTDARSSAPAAVRPPPPRHTYRRMLLVDRVQVPNGAVASLSAGLCGLHRDGAPPSPSPPSPPPPHPSPHLHPHRLNIGRAWATFPPV